MILLQFYIFQVSSISSSEHWYNTTFCVCEDTKNINCTKVCPKYRKIGYNYKDILKITRKYHEPHITFLIYGTTESKSPEFYISDYLNFSLNILSATSRKEYIILNGINKKSQYYNLDTDELIQDKHNKDSETIDISNEVYARFSNLNIYFYKEKYIFNHLMLYNSFLLPYSNSALSRKTSIFQNFLTSDFTSFSKIPNQIKHVSPKYRIQIICNESVNHVYFLEDHQILLQIDPSIQTTNNSLLREVNTSIDLRNLKKNIRANIVLISRNLKMTFKFMPKNEEELPKIDFRLKKSAKIHIDTNNMKFDDKMMKINNINFVHGTSSIYFYSDDKEALIPTFAEQGVGTVYKNNEVTLFYNNYCICEGNDCATKCGSDNDHIIPYDIRSIDKTVVGNPSNKLKYVISNSSPESGKHPIFDLEHFGDKTLTVIGITNDEHIEFIGDATDDIGTFSFTKLCFHGNHLLFPEVFLHDVRIENQTTNKSEIVLNSTLLKSDVATLKSIYNSHIHICEPFNGYEIHTNNILNQVTLQILSPTLIKLDNSLELNLRKKSTMKIFSGGIVNIFLGDDNSFRKIPTKVTSFPNLRIYLEGDKNVVTFPGNQWPDSLRDISSKLTLIHGENDAYINGNTNYEKNTDNPVYNTIPPIVDHEGTGAFFLNGKLSNYAEKYCICEPINESSLNLAENEEKKNQCEYLCENYGPITGFSAEEIENKAIGNPIRSIQYFIVQSSENRNPQFNLVQFAEKSFSIVGVGENRQFISLAGTYDTKFASSSVSHLFQNIDIDLSSAGFYFFNNVEFSNCLFRTNVKVSNSTHKVIETKSNAIRIYHFGMTIDMISLRSLNDVSPSLIYPSKNYLHIDGGSFLKAISIENARYISLFSDEEFVSGIRIDVSMLFTPVHISTTFGDTLKQPFNVQIKETSLHHLEDLPNCYIDVQNVPSGESYLMFTGRKNWDGEFHNLTSKITVFYGQTNIHLMTKVTNLKKEIFSGLPPHVSLVGDGEYYINKEKQGSIFAPGNIVNSDDDEIDDGRGILFWILIIVALLLLSGFVYFRIILPKKRSLAFYERWKNNALNMLSDSDISLNRFEMDLDDVALSD